MSLSVKILFKRWTLNVYKILTFYVTSINFQNNVYFRPSLRQLKQKQLEFIIKSNAARISSDSLRPNVECSQIIDKTQFVDIHQTHLCAHTSFVRNTHVSCVSNIDCYLFSSFFNTNISTMIFRLRFVIARLIKRSTLNG